MTIRLPLKDSKRLELAGTAFGIFNLRKSISGLEKDFCKVIECPVEAVSLIPVISRECILVLAQRTLNDLHT